MKGRKKKPASIRIAEGNPGHRPINDTVKSPTGRVLCPRWLSDDAKVEWRRIVPGLVSSGVMLQIDENAMARYVHCLVGWREAVAQLKEHGTIIDDRASPWVKIRRDLSAEMSKTEAEFGMSAASRCRIVVTPKVETKEPDIEAFVNSKPKLTIKK